MKNINSVRVHYTYFDNKEGILQGSMDLLTEGGKFVSEKSAKKSIIEKWQKSGYVDAFYDSISNITFEN